MRTTIDAVLLTHGGTRVVHQDDQYDGVLARSGAVFRPKKVTLKKGQERNCHRNSSGLYLLHHPAYRIATGYALLDDVWIRHSWLLAGDTIIETTTKFPLYFGVVLDDFQAARFVVGTVIDTSPELMAVCNKRIESSPPPSAGSGSHSCEADYGVRYYGDAVLPTAGEHDLRSLVVEAVSRLPADVREWLLEDTTHVFLGGSGQDGEYIEIAVHPSEFVDGFAKLRVIYLSERLAAYPRDEVLWTVAHEVAHSRLDHAGGGYDVEVDADDLVRAWGFAEPPDRGEEREKYPTSAR